MGNCSDCTMRLTLRCELFELPKWDSYTEGMGICSDSRDDTHTFRRDPVPIVRKSQETLTLWGLFELSKWDHTVMGTCSDCGEETQALHAGTCSHCRNGTHTLMGTCFFRGNGIHILMGTCYYCGMRLTNWWKPVRNVGEEIQTLYVGTCSYCGNGVHTLMGTCFIAGIGPTHLWEPVRIVGKRITHRCMGPVPTAGMRNGA